MTSLGRHQTRYLDYSVRYYEQYISRQLRRHALAARRCLLNCRIRRPNRLCDVFMLSRARHSINRYYRLLELRRRRHCRGIVRQPCMAQPSLPREFTTHGHTSPHCATTLPATFAEEQTGQISQFPPGSIREGEAPPLHVNVASAASSSVVSHSCYVTSFLNCRLNRLLRRFILAQRRSRLRQPPSTVVPCNTPSMTVEISRGSLSSNLAQQSFGGPNHFRAPNLPQCGHPSTNADVRPPPLFPNREGQNSRRSENLRRRRISSARTDAPVVVHDLGYPNQACDHCGAVTWLAELTNKTDVRARPRYGICCQGGSVQLPLLQEPPPFLKYLLESGDRKAVIFRENIRPYNSVFAFTSIGAKVDGSINDGRGLYVFRLNGLNYHRIGSLLLVHDRHPCFAQLYFHDSGNELSDRTRALSGGREAADLDESIVAEFISMFAQCNPLAQAFKFARERFVEENLANMRLRLIGSRDKDARQYNLPTASEVAAIMVDNNAQRGSSRDIIVENRTLGLQRISEVHPSFMQYPLLFPYGEDGFMLGILMRNASGNANDNDSISFFFF